MNRRSLVCALALLGAASGQASCNKTPPANHHTSEREEKAAPKTDIEGLSRLVDLPYAPTSVKWATEKFSQGDNWGLNALLVLRNEDIQKLLKDAEILPNCHPKVTRELLLTWFPAAVQSETKAALDAKHDVVSVDASCVRPTPFTMPEKSPAIHGDALVFEKHNLVLLDLYTM